MQEILAELFVAFPTSADASNAKAKVLVYTKAIEDLPPWATRQAVADFLKAKVPGHNQRFLPTTAELAAHARSVMNQRSQAEYKRIASSKPAEPEPEPMSDEERERRAEQVQRLLSAVSGNA